MKKEQLFESMQGIDEDILERSEKTLTYSRVWKYLVPLAACFCLIVAAAIPGLIPADVPTLPGLEEPPVQTTPEDAEPTRPPAYSWTVSYNTSEMLVSADRAPIPGYFTQELSDREIAAVVPEKQLAWMRYSGTAGFDGEGTLVQVRLQVTTTLPESDVGVVIGDDLSCCVVEPSTVLSRCGEVEYAVYEWDTGTEQITLKAGTRIDEIPFSFTVSTSKSDLEQAKADFEAVLECFAWYAEGKPDLAAVTADNIPEWFDLKLSLSEAVQDADFGSHMLQDIPGGFAEESIRRYKDQNSDYLSGLWTKGLDELSWSIAYYEETDAARLTSVADTENYDLSLYPIPRAESVPDGLRQIVDDPIFHADELTLDAVYARAYQINDAGDTDGWRMAFSVKYGNLIVRVRTKGIDPEWLYEQLISLR